MNNISFRNAVLCAAGAVAAFHAAYSAPACGLLIFVYLFCLLQLARLSTARRAFYSGLGTGLLCVAPQLACFWVIFGPTAIVLWVILAFWIGLFVAIARLCMIRFGTIRATMLIPFVWTGLEYFRGELYYLRFSWLNVGYALADTPLRPVLHWTGMYGVGFVGMAAAGGLSLLLAGAARRTTLRTEGQEPSSGAETVKTVSNTASPTSTQLKLGVNEKDLSAGLGVFCGLIAIMILVAIVSGCHNREEVGNTSQKVLRIAGVQLEFPIPTEVISALDKLLAADASTELFVLSEYTFDGAAPEIVKAWCREHQRYLIVGGKEAAPNRNFYNTVFVIGPTGEIIFQQGKSVPIQFFRDGLPAREQKIWDSPWGKIGICICYDLSYRRVVDNSPRADCVIAQAHPR